MVMLLHYGVVVLRPPAEKLNYKILPPPPRAAGRARPGGRNISESGAPHLSSSLPWGAEA